MRKRSSDLRVPVIHDLGEMFQIMFHRFGIFLDTAELLDSQPGYMALIVSDLLDKQIKVFYAAPVLDDGFRLTGLEVFQSIDVILVLKFSRALM